MTVSPLSVIVNLKNSDVKTSKPRRYKIVFDFESAIDPTTDLLFQCDFSLVWASILLHRGGGIIVWLPVMPTL